MIGVKLQAGSVRATIASIDTTRVTMDVAAQRASHRAGLAMLAALKLNLSARDHSLRALAAMGHPYARRHGSIQIHSGSSRYLTDSRATVHSRSGAMFRAAFSRVIRTTSGHTAQVGIDPAVAPHAQHVVGGTRRMLPRNVVTLTVDAPGTQEDVKRAIVDELGRVLRAKAAVRFG